MVVGFSDGSALQNPGPASAAAVVRFQKESWSKTELKAILLVLDLFIEHTLTENQKLSKLTFCIFSDSKYSVNVCNQSWSAAPHHRPIVCKIAEKLLQIQQYSAISVKIVEIKGHSGIQGNDIADKLAKNCLRKALQNSKLEKEKVLLPFAVAKVEAKIAMMAKWQKQWNRAQTGRQLFRICPKVSDQPFQALALNHRDFGLFSRLLTGHIGLNEYLFKRHLLSYNMCTNCNLQKVETVEHFLLKCPKYQDQRKSFFMQHSTIVLTNCIPTVNTILKINIDWSELLALLDFVKSTNRFS